MATIKIEEARDLKNSFKDVKRNAMVESLGTWFNVSAMDTKKTIAKAEEMLEKLNSWTQNWTLILTEQKGKKQLEEKNVAISILDGMSDEVRREILAKYNAAQ